MAFAEIEKFIDMQVRHYSSGMYVRLGFAVAVNVEPDILLVDEVLSVGDEAFQRKCIERVKKFQDEGRTILFVTHAADLVRRICGRGIVLDHGQMVIDAAPGEAVRVFRESLQGGELSEAETGAEATVGHRDGRAARRTHRVHITNVEIDHPGLLLDRKWLLPDEALTVRVSYDATERTDDILFGIAIHDENGNHLFGTNTAILGVDVPPADGRRRDVVRVPPRPAARRHLPGDLAIQTADEGTVYDWREQRGHFEVMNPSRTNGLVSFPIDVRFGNPAMEPAEGTGRERPPHGGRAGPARVARRRGALAVVPPHRGRSAPASSSGRCTTTSTPRVTTARRASRRARSRSARPSTRAPRRTPTRARTSCGASCPCSARSTSGARSGSSSRPNASSVSTRPAST